jgi:hypothetical protein
MFDLSSSDIDTSQINSVLTPSGNITTALNAMNASVVFNLLESIQIPSSNIRRSPKQCVGVGGCAREPCKHTSLPLSLHPKVLTHSYSLQISISTGPSSILRRSINKY